MRLIITGSRGTVGSALLREARQRGHDVVRWNRSEVSPLDFARMEAFINDTNPDVLYHLAIASRPTGIEGEAWRINYEWSSEIAWICARAGVKLVFTSTVMVFSDDARGPFSLYAAPDAAEGYGYEKRMAEKRVMHQNPESSIVRLGWQIGERPGSNNMIDFLEREMKLHGHVAASTEWLPACSFLDDTARALLQLMDLPPSIYMLDANRQWSFFEIASALNRTHGSPWTIEPGQSFVFDQRMQDQRISLPPLSQRLPGLRKDVSD